MALLAVLGGAAAKGGSRAPSRPLAERPGVALLLAGNLLACRGVGAQWGDGSTSRVLGSHIALWLAGIPLHYVNREMDNHKSYIKTHTHNNMQIINHKQQGN